MYVYIYINDITTALVYTRDVIHAYVWELCE